MATRTTLTYLNAAIAVLETSGSPLTTQQIVEAAMQRGLLVPRSKTPLKSMDAELYRSVQDEQHSRIVRVSEPGITRARKGTVRWTLKKSSPGH